MARAPRLVADPASLPFMPQEDDVRKVSAVMFHPAGLPDVHPDFDPAREPSAEDVAAVDEGLRLQREDAGA